MKLFIVLCFALISTLGEAFFMKNPLFPDLSLALITAFSLLPDTSWAQCLSAGVLGGFFRDSFFGRFFGYYSFLLGGMGFLGGRLKKILNTGYISVLVLSFSFCLLTGLLALRDILNGGFSGESALVDFVRSFLFPKSLITAGSALLLFMLLKALFEKIDFDSARKRAAIRK